MAALEASGVENPLGDRRDLGWCRSTGGDLSPGFHVGPVILAGDRFEGFDAHVLKGGIAIVERNHQCLHGITCPDVAQCRCGGEANINANLTVAAALNNSGTLRVSSGRTLTFGTQHLINGGTVELAGGTLSANGSTNFGSSGVISGFGAITLNNTSFTTSGLMSVSGGNLTIGSNFTATNTGSVSVPAGRQLQWNSVASFG